MNIKKKTFLIKERILLTNGFGKLIHKDFVF